jgi:arylsulfatase A-like enzyme
MKRLWSCVELLYLGALVGGFVGIVTGSAEYVYLFFGEAFSDNLAKSYWDIVLPYTLVGICGGIPIALGVRLLRGRPASFGQGLTRLFAACAALGLFAYLMVWATYWLGLPVLKLANLVAYVAAAGVATVVGLLLRRLFGALYARLERLDNPIGHAFRAWMPLALGGLIAGLLLVPPMSLQGMEEAQETHAEAALEGTSQNRPNVVFILIDALRADHLPMYGYSRQTAPNLTAFAQRGMTFTHMYAQAASTRPSVATIFSSLYPIVHKANENRDFLSDGITVLPEILRANGYKTFAVSANANVSPTFGYAQGFDEFRVWKTESSFRITMMGRLAEDLLETGRLARLLGERADIVPQAAAITDSTLAWVASQGRKQPMFLYVHYIDPHDPYRPPAPYDKVFDYRRNPPRRLGDVDPLALLPDWQDKDHIGQILDQYDGEILYADNHIGRLLQGLEKAGVLDNAMVIVTADHGEEFYEHGKDRHGKSAYEEVLRVPFIVSWPGKIAPSSTSADLVGLIDVMPTLLKLLHITPLADSQGMSFASTLLSRPEEEDGAKKLFAQVIQDGFALEMIRDRDYKLVRHTHGPQEGFEELYDLERDPLERTNMAPHAVAHTNLLRQDLDTFNGVVNQIASLIQAEKVQKLDKDTERALRSLGYIK